MAVEDERSPTKAHSESDVPSGARPYRRICILLLSICLTAGVLDCGEKLLWSHDRCLLYVQWEMDSAGRNSERRLTDGKNIEARNVSKVNSRSSSYGAFPDSIQLSGSSRWVPPFIVVGFPAVNASSHTVGNMFDGRFRGWKPGEDFLIPQRVL